MSVQPAITRKADNAIASSPEEQNRLMVAPEVPMGKPAI